MKLRFDAIYYRVSDLDRAICFYRDVLGLQLVRRDVVACFELDGVTVELVPDETVPDPRAGGNARLCFRVEDIRAARAELAEKIFARVQWKRKATACSRRSVIPTATNSSCGSIADFLRRSQ
jgi:catechol 2,3-dioxygenase-like lactoylglutathione lyase family enzyme